jgi:hypothetical protein
MDMSERSDIAKKTLNLDLRTFVAQLGDPYACVPEENYRLLTTVLQNQHAIQRIVELLETQEAHKMISQTLTKMQESDELMTPDRLEELDGQTLVAYQKMLSDRLGKLWGMSREPKQNSVVQNLFMVDSTKDPIKNGMTADERTGVRLALEKLVGKLAMSCDDKVFEMPAEVVPEGND